MQPKFLFAKILITGGIVLGLELVASRILTPFFGVSLFVWSGILSVTLLALALGYKGGGILAGRVSREQSVALFLASGALSALWLDLCLWTYPFIFAPLAQFDLVFGSILACVYLLFVPLVVLSALNPLLVSLLSAGEGQGDRGAGHVFFVSTIGSVLGVFVVAYGMLPFVTNYQTVAILTLAAAALSVTGLWGLRRTQRRLFLTSLAAFLITFTTLCSGGLERFSQTASLDGVIWKVTASAPSSFGNLKTVDLIDEKSKMKMSRLLLNDGMTQNVYDSLGRPSGLYTFMLERLALAASPDARKALVLGIGGGTVPANFVADSMEVHAVDINHRIVDFSRQNLGLDTTGMTLEIADARTAARNCSHDYDIVTVDLFRDDGIPEHLVTREFFADIKNCLKDQGVMLMNTFMSTADQRPEFALVQTIASVFGEVHFAWEPKDDQTHLTSAFIVVRKGGPVGPLDYSTNNMPAPMIATMNATMRTSCVFKAGDPALKGAPILTDISNQWKNLSHPVELSYRTAIAGFIPWQMLLN
ncbi:MAG: conserved rane protein of unknown function [Micavibrio sp.]|nr:conserved rane protein of unknown function [Micavibrio sp.]